MSNTTYQVYFTGKDGKREFYSQNFYDEAKAQEAVEKLISQGFKDATWEGFSFDLSLP